MPAAVQIAPVGIKNITMCIEIIPVSIQIVLAAIYIVPVGIENIPTCREIIPASIQIERPYKNLQCRLNMACK